MKDILKLFVKIIQVVSFCGLMLTGVTGVIYEILGFAKFERLLSSIGIPNGLQRVWIFGTIMLLLLIATSFIKDKFLTD